MQSPQRKLAVIMFADIVGYTALMQRNEGAALLARERHKKAVEDAADQFNGEVVQFYGDGALLLFSSALQAVVAASSMQKAMQQAPKVDVRIGMHLGDVILDQGNVYGDCVNLASRIESVAVSGSVMLSDKVVVELANHPDVKVTEIGEFEFKNVSRPIRVYALNAEGLVIPKPESVRSEKAKKSSRTIAIFPFIEQGIGANDFFAEGVTEEVIGGLTRVEGMSVMSETTVHAILKCEDKLAEGRRLGVSQYLEGKVRRAGQRVRVSVNLINTADGYQVWSETYDRQLNDIFEVQDEIAKHVINALKVNFNISAGGKSLLEKPTDNLDAYTLYLKGMHHAKRRTPKDTKKAVQLFNQALELDPEYAAAQCALSACHAYLGSCGEAPPADAYARALQCAMSAVASAPKSGDGQLALANIKFYHFWDWEGARESLEQAEAMGLDSANLHQSYGLYYAAVGRLGEGVAKMRKALKLDPLSIPVLNSLATLYLFNEEYLKAIEVYDEILDLEPTFRSAMQYKGVTLLCMDRFEEALEVLREYHAMVNDPAKGLTGLILALFYLGETEEAEEYIGRLTHRVDQEQSTSAEIDLAIIYAGIGEFDKCVELMERVYAKRLSVACMGIIWIMRCPAFRELWDRPNYIALTAKMGIPARPETSIV